MEYTKIGFIEALSQKLSSLPKSEVIDIISYYQELIDDAIEEGRDEHELISSLAIDDIALMLLSNIDYDYNTKVNVTNDYKVKNRTYNKYFKIKKGLNEIPLELEKGIDINISTSKVQILIYYSNIDSPMIRVFSNYKNQFRCYLNDALSIYENKRFNWKEIVPFYLLFKRLFNRYRFIPKLELILPANQELGIINIKNKNNKINIQDIKFEKGFIDNKNGKTIIENFTSKEVNIKNKNGGIIINCHPKVILEKININNKNGSIKSDNLTSYEVNVQNSNGSIKVNNIAVHDMNFNCHNGSVKIQTAKFSNFKGTTHNGSIKLFNVSNSKNDYNLKFIANYGSVKINDKKIGLISNSNPNSNKNIELMTHNGSIKLNFEKDNFLKTI